MRQDSALGGTEHLPETNNKQNIWNFCLLITLERGMQFIVTSKALKYVLDLDRKKPIKATAASTQDKHDKT